MKKIVTAENIRKAAKGTKIVLIKKDTLVTPLAREMAAELSVRIEEDRSVPIDPDKFRDIFPVKVVAVASDHGGFEMKKWLIPFLHKLGYIAHDLGTFSVEACDYPDFAFKAAEAVSAGKADRAIIIDSVGIGSAMAANRVPGVLAAKCNNTFEAHSAREHNYANVLTLGAKIIGSEIAKSIVQTFLETAGGAERHKKRIEKILDRRS